MNAVEDLDDGESWERNCERLRLRIVSRDCHIDFIVFFFSDSV